MKKQWSFFLFALTTIVVGSLKKQYFVRLCRKRFRFCDCFEGPSVCYIGSDPNCLLVFLSFLSCSLFALCIDVDSPISANHPCVHSCNRYKYEMPIFKEVEVSDYLSDVFRLNGFGGETVFTVYIRHKDI